MKELIIKVDEEKMDIEGNAPIVEKPRELVRCKDCRKNMMCEMTIHKPKDWFCADGLVVSKAETTTDSNEGGEVNV